MKEEECEKKIADLSRQIRNLNHAIHKMVSLQEVLQMLSVTYHINDIIEAWPDKGEIDALD